MKGVSQGMARLLASLPTPIVRTNDLERVLKVDNPLASRVFRIANAENPIEAAELLPTINQFRAVVRAAEKAGVGQQVCQRAISAIEALDEFIRIHAGDLGQFEALVSLGKGMDGGGAAGESLRLKHRRTAFRANCQVWQMQAAQTAVSGIYHEGESAGIEHALVIRGYADLRVLRPNHRLDVSTRLQHYQQDTDYNSEDSLQKGSIRPSLIEGFIRGPRPKVVTAQGKQGLLESHVSLPTLGKANASTFFTQQLVRDTDSMIEPDPKWEIRVFVKVPSESLIIDLLVPAGLTDPATVCGEAFGCASAPEQALEGRPADRLDAQSVVQTYLNVAADDPPPATEIARWSEMLASVMAEHGLADRRFDVYRCRMKYPLLHSVVGLRVGGKKK